MLKTAFDSPDLAFWWPGVGRRQPDQTANGCHWHNNGIPVRIVAWRQPAQWGLLRARKYAPLNILLVRRCHQKNQPTDRTPKAGIRNWPSSRKPPVQPSTWQDLFFIRSFRYEDQQPHHRHRCADRADANSTVIQGEVRASHAMARQPGVCEPAGRAARRHGLRSFALYHFNSTQKLSLQTGVWARCCGGEVSATQVRVGWSHRTHIPEYQLKTIVRDIDAAAGAEPDASPTPATEGREYAARLRLLHEQALALLAQ